VIKGWVLCFESRIKGEEFIIVFVCSVGYGARGAGGVIGPGATLLFEVELISFVGGSSEEL
jgi:FKBP-type peptidyl-prolyl cis-trans isomerase